MNASVPTVRRGLAENSQTDQALSAIAAQPEPESQAAYGAFFAQNPQWRTSCRRSTSRCRR